MGAHALLSPSAAHRWLNCTAAPRLEAGVEDRGSSFAEEGTLAHAYCARKLKQYLGQDTTAEDAEIAELNDKYHTGEMDEYTDTYVAIVLEKLNEARQMVSDAQLLVEVRLDFGKHIPDAFGTSDAVIIADGVMEVIDFKYGKGVRVDADNNPQMMIYALGAYELMSFEYDIRTVRMTIVQPRLDNLSEFEMGVDDLMVWTDTILKPRAEEAYSGKGHQMPGEWCRFCKVKSQCRALAENCVKAVNSDPSLLTRQEIEQHILPLLPTVKSWLSGMEEYTLEQALAGVKYEGYKLVEGRSVRRISDPKAVMETLQGEGYDEADYLKPTELRTITDLEKLVGKKKFTALCGDSIVKPQGKPTLVPESDKRPPYNAASADFEGINV
jgi:antitoxin component of MazEF toxin-antitoxin module